MVKTIEFYGSTSKKSKPKKQQLQQQQTNKNTNKIKSNAGYCYVSQLKIWPFKIKYRALHID